jgi:uncharacterized protein
MIDDDMRAVIAAQRLCFAATVGADGRPNLSPKGTIRVWDHRHLVFCDIDSPCTRTNLESNPWMEINVVDAFSRRGYRFLGRGTVHADDRVYRDAIRRHFPEESKSYEIHAVVLVEVERALAVVSPGYELVADEFAMRELWRRRRADLDADFEAHLHERGPLPGGAG